MNELEDTTVEIELESTDAQAALECSRKVDDERRSDEELIEHALTETYGPFWDEPPADGDELSGRDELTRAELEESERKREEMSIF